MMITKHMHTQEADVCITHLAEGMDTENMVTHSRSLEPSVDTPSFGSYQRSHSLQDGVDMGVVGGGPCLEPLPHCSSPHSEEPEGSQWGV